MSNYLEGRRPPEITRHRGGIRLSRTWQFRGIGYVVRIRHGFATDLASVPRVLWWLVSPMDLTFAAPILHDFLYQCGGKAPPGAVYPSGKTFTRREVDKLFSQLMDEEGVTPWRRKVAWLAVRLFGWIPWKGAK